MRKKRNKALDRLDNQAMTEKTQESMDREKVLEVVPDLDELLAKVVQEIEDEDKLENELIAEIGTQPDAPTDNNVDKNGKKDRPKVMYYDDLPAYGDDDDPLQEMQKEDETFRTKKVAGIRGRLYLWRMDVADSIRRLFRKPKSNPEEQVTPAEKVKPKARHTSKKQKGSRKDLKQKAKAVIKAERERLYNQFLNHLLLLLVNGIAVGGLLLAGLDYFLVAHIPERSPLILYLLLGITVYSLIYWLVTYKKNKNIEGMRFLAVFALIISIIGTSVGVYSVTTNKKNLDTYFRGENIIIKDKQNTANILASYIDIWRHTPNYSIIQISDTAYYVTVYNSKGESITQLINDGDPTNDTVDKVTGETTETVKDIAICLRDSTAVIVSEDAIERRRDVDNLRYVELAYQWAAKGKANIERVSTAGSVIPKSQVPVDAMPGTEYVVIIQGLSKIREFYSTVLGTVAANEMLHSVSMVSDIELRFHMTVDTGYLGVASIIAVDGVDNLLWFIDNYVEVYDWSLGEEDWYRYDFTDAKKNELMIQEALYNATSMLEQFGLDSGISYDAIQSHE